MEEKILKIVQIINSKVSEDAVVEHKKIKKQGDIEYNAIFIREPGIVMIPTIYIDEMLDAGKSEEFIADRVIELHNELKNVDYDFKAQISDIHSWEHIKDKLSYMLINYESNKSYLQDRVHRMFYDMAIVPYVKFDKCAHVTVTKEMCNMWGQTEDEVIREAEGNLSFGIEKDVLIEDLAELIKQMHDSSDPEIVRFVTECKNDDLEIEGPSGFTVITNKNKNYGAPYGLIPYVLKKIANECDTDLFICPSSVHECIVIKAEDGDVDLLPNIIREVNVNVVSPDEVLSNKLFRYFRKSMEIKAV